MSIAIYRREDWEAACAEATPTAVLPTWTDAILVAQALPDQYVVVERMFDRRRPTHTCASEFIAQVAGG